MANNKNDSPLTLIDAVETLSNIADMDMDKEIGITKKHNFVMQDQEFQYRTIHWLHKNNTSETIGFVKDIFKVVLNYLKNFYKNDYTLVTDSKTLDGIKTIMVLVGEAAKKIDKYTHLFHQKHIKSVTELKEYKQLQDFYLRKISRTIDEGVLGKWILALSHKTLQPKKLKLTGVKPFATKYMFVDFESVKKDSEYELFAIRKEDGSRFFNSRIIRNIKLICDFGNYFGHEKDPLTDIAIWKDRQAENSASCILNSVNLKLDKLFKNSAIKESELFTYVNKAIMALMLAKNRNNRVSNEPVKNCLEYFRDFQLFLRQVLSSQAYQKALTYKKEDGSQNITLDLIFSLCDALYTANNSLSDLKAFIHYILEEAYSLQSDEHLVAARNSGLLWSRLASDYAALQKLFRRHPSGPLNNVINQLENDRLSVFDPYFNENLPNLSFSITIEQDKFVNVHLPCPTRQEFIHKADILPEFKTFLKENGVQNTKHLLFNLQDRTSWKEYARTHALEELNDSNEIVVVTLTKDSEFYQQLAPYNEDHQTAQFFKHIKEHLKSAHSGFYFPENIKALLTDEWIDSLINAIHTCFFSSKNVLSREARLDFIELLYTCIELKILEEVRPRTFSFTCKDGIDSGALSSAQLYCFLKIFSKKECTQDELQNLNVMLYGPSILNRERIPAQERFNRFISMLRTLESSKNDTNFNIFNSLFKQNWTNSHTLM